MTELTNQQQAALLTFAICTPYRTSCQSKVHPNFAKMLYGISCEGFRNCGNNIFNMSPELYDQAELLKNNTEVKKHSDKIFKIFGN